MLSSAVLMSLVLSFVLCFRSMLSVPPLCVVQSKTKQQSAKEPKKTLSVCPQLTLFTLDEHMHLREHNQPFTDCLSSSSCLRSQSASERTMVSWGSEEEEASPWLVVTPEERGVRGIRVSSSILCSWVMWRDRQLLSNTQVLFYIHFICASEQKHTSSWYFLSSSATSLCAFSHSSFSFSCSRWYFSCYHGNRHGGEKWRAPAKIPLKVRTFEQEKPRSANRLKKKRLKGFLDWKFDIQLLLYAS